MDRRIEELRVKMGFANCFSVDRAGRSGGLAVFWKRTVDCSIFGYSQNHIDLVFKENNLESWWLSCFYGYPESHRRRESWNFIRNLAQLSPLPWCIIGDFNDMLFSSDKKGVHPHPISLLDGFSKAVEDSELIEVDLCGGSFTWEKSRGTHNWVQERLDIAFATQDWWTKFPLCKLNLLMSPVSDHNPVHLVLFDISISRKVFRFRFENIWLKEPSFVKETSEFWKSIPLTHLIPKLQSVSGFMEKWGRNFFNKFREKLRRQKEVLDNLKDRTDESSVRIFLVEKEKLNELLMQKELYWKQRAKLFWLKEGDENTRFFHASASARKKANHISFLENDDGIRVDDPEGM